MISKPWTIFLFFLFITTQLTFSQRAAHPIDVKNKQCHKNALPTTNASMSCESNALKAWKKEMDMYLEHIKKKSEQVDIASFEISQKKWQEFFKAEVVVYNSYLNKLYKGGTLSRVASLTYKKEKMRKRTLELKYFFENLE